MEYLRKKEAVAQEALYDVESRKRYIRKASFDQSEGFTPKVHLGMLR